MKKVISSEMRAVEGGAYYTYCDGGYRKYNAITVRAHKTFCSLCHLYTKIGNPKNGNKTYCYIK